MYWLCKKFDAQPENFANHEIVFCPICGLDHEIVQQTRQAIIELIQLV